MGMNKQPPKESPHKLRPDVAETAFRVMQEATGEAPRTDPETRPTNPEAVTRGAQGGVKGGKARAKGLSRSERSRIAKNAAKARWSRPEGPPE